MSRPSRERLRSGPRRPLPRAGDRSHPALSGFGEDLPRERSWSWTTSPPCATRSTARCGSDGYRVTLADDGARGARRARRASRPTRVVLDVLMPELDGLEVCRRLRAAGDRTPVLMLTARDAVPDRVEGLDAGADDYLVKPFALEELLARLRALLRRSRRAEPASRCASPTSSSTPRPRRCAAAGGDRAHAHRVPAARAVPAPPAPGADARRRSSSASGATTSARARTRSRSTSATCAARSRRTASRG